MKRKEKDRIKDATLIGIENDSFQWRVTTNSKKTLVVTEPIALSQKLQYIVMPMTLWQGDTKIKMCIPEEFLSIQEVKTFWDFYQKEARGSGIHFMQKVYEKLKKNFPEKVDLILDDLKRGHADLLDIIENMKDKGVKHLDDFWTLPDYDFMKLKVLRSVPQTGWKEDKGDSEKMIYDAIPGQTTVISISGIKKDGSFRPAHLTQKSKQLLAVLWTKHHEDREHATSQITYADICSRLGWSVSGSSYSDIEKLFADLMFHTIYYEHGKRKGMLHLLSGWEKDEGPTGKMIKYQIPDWGGVDKHTIKVSPNILEGLNAGQDNIVQHLISNRAKTIPEFENLEYHHYQRNLKTCISEMAYLPGAHRGDRHIKRFFKDLEALKKLRPRHPENTRQPGFTYKIERSSNYRDLPLFEDGNSSLNGIPLDGKVIHLYHYKVRG